MYIIKFIAFFVLLMMFQELMAQSESSRLDITPVHSRLDSTQERMPIWYTCDSSFYSYKETQVCTMERAAQYVYDHLEIPKRAQKKRLSGKVVVSFTVEVDGSISDVKVLRDIGGGCGKAVKNIIESMPDWIPAIQKGEFVSVRFNYPINIYYDN